MAYEQIEVHAVGTGYQRRGLPLVKYTHNPEKKIRRMNPNMFVKRDIPAIVRMMRYGCSPPFISIFRNRNIGFLDEVVSYANNGESGTVYDHLKRAISFSMNNLGSHGMPAGLHADWNDCLRLGKKGESTFVAFQLYYAVTI